MSTTTIKFFKHEHLPPFLQDVAMSFSKLAEEMEELLQDSPEKSAGMRKLLEAKDCFVRARLEEMEKL